MTVQIKTMKKTLLAAKTVHGGKGWITKGGRRAASARPAAPRARSTRRRTAAGPARYFTSVGGIFITSILGVKPPAKTDFWSIFVNGKSSSKGICGIKLRAGQRLLFKIVK